MSAEANLLRKRIRVLVREYFQEAFPAQPFVAGETTVPVSGRVFDAEELEYLIESALDFWLTSGRFAAEFEQKFAKFFGIRAASLVNSGSSANLLAVAALTSPKLVQRRLLPGDEVITVAAGFPTTVNPILQCGLVPVFVDVQIPTYNVDPGALEMALSPRTRVVMLAHTLGNPFDVPAVLDFVKRHDLWLIEDCCDALGATYHGRSVGTFGDLATTSFYPAHHITMGEGGCVLSNTPLLTTVVESFRDWGRDCWCDPGKANTCGKRFDWDLGDLPHGYDHKYCYSHIGYNLKATDMQAAVGLAQLKKLPAFVAARKKNFVALRAGLSDLEEFFIFPEPTANSDPSWFGFLLMVRDDAPFTRDQVIRFLEERKIATRNLFGGNLVRQPAYHDAQFRIAGELRNADAIMNQAFWIGLYPGISDAMLEYVVDTFHQISTAMVQPHPGVSAG